ncbi:hypothetical protein A8709_28040 [Paenibacillus pectinilyticus]|uniref:Uncharacterized protein n=1 Tax=Paenibacillus pectinilyticus TaxID=512399 RepID=A0A1C0ZUJ6_9BACL|nr:hypothetical protein [Paenibacillus pectinilyticus]OCT11728.1 hypothetical protein A8709_28040 [Paenibacillus pectinilyticus]
MTLLRKPLEVPSVTAKDNWTPPAWALLECKLFETLNQAAKEFVQKYVRPDGTLIWRSEWPGMDGSDDPYEGFMYLALLYALGGDEELREMSLRIWEGVTWQWTEYGQIYRDFDSYYDWMHHGEGYLFFYFLGLAAPSHLKNVQRAQRFASFYTGKDAEAHNYDAEKKLIRSPITGSRGPRHEMSEEDWCTHRGILDNYLAPFEDIPGVDFASGTCPWSDDHVYGNLIRIMNERMAKGDVPLNLNATGPIANAYMYSGDAELKKWVLDYVHAWRERAEQNGGIIPDNIGLSGEIGEYNDGKWWGGYYGWRWPHGFLTIIEPIVNASMNAVLLSGDMNYLCLAREQLDRNWELGHEENGSWVTPTKHFDSGWTSYRLPNPLYPIHLWTVSMAEEDAARADRIDKLSYDLDIDVPEYSGTNPITGKNTKHYNGNTVQWFHYMRGKNPDYPKQILEANYKLVSRQLQKMRSEEGDPNNWISDGFSLGALSSIHKWQEMCPVYFEGLLQLTLGSPMHTSHGGLQHGRVRYFNADLERPGLPDGTAALVEALHADSVTLNLVNLDLFADKQIIIQAGMFGEHQFEIVTVTSQEDHVQETLPANNKWFLVKLLPGAGIRLHMTMNRYVNQPTYETPWANPQNTGRISGREK